MRTRAGSPSALKTSAVASASSSDRLGVASGAQQTTGSVTFMVINISMTFDVSTAELRVLDEHVADAVRSRLAGVDRILERLVDVLPADHDHRVDPAVLEQAGARGARDVVAAVLDRLDLDDALRGTAQALQLDEQLRELLCRLHEQR